MTPTLEPVAESPVSLLRVCVSDEPGADYLFSAVVIRRGDEADVKLASGTFNRAMDVAIRKRLKSEGIRTVYWERWKRGKCIPRKVEL